MFKPLDIRCEFALNKVLSLANPYSIALLEESKKILIKAQIVGRIDHFKRNPKISAYFEDEPLLSLRWQIGLNEENLESVIRAIDSEIDANHHSYEDYISKRQIAIKALLSADEFTPEFITLIQSEHAPRKRVLFETDFLGTAYSTTPFYYRGPSRVVVKGHSIEELIFPNVFEANCAATWAIGELGGYHEATVHPACSDKKITHRTAEKWFLEY